MRNDDAREDNTTTSTPAIPATDDTPAQATPNDEGLAPAAAGDWLALQSLLAWEPEAVGSRLRAGRTARQVLAELRGQLELPRSGFHDSAAESGPRNPVNANGGERSTRVKRLAESDLRVVPLTDVNYPAILAELVDAPPVLVVRGRVSVLRTPAIAIVGARAATRSARETARTLARELASAGLTIVSGLARGIDAEAHRGALDAKGRTIAVQACGLDRVYPPEHRSLASEIAKTGAVISEMPFGTPPRSALFPLRNRIISGLCSGIIVVEARRRSGSLITVRHALTQGREVFVVPGSIDGPFAEGTNQLLRDGARPICCARDVIEDLGFELSSRSGTEGNEAAVGNDPAAPTTSSFESRILRILWDGPVTRDELIDRMGCAGTELAGGLLELELAGRILLERDGRIHAKSG